VFLNEKTYKRFILEVLDAMLVDDQAKRGSHTVDIRFVRTVIKKNDHFPSKVAKAFNKDGNQMIQAHSNPMPNPPKSRKYVI